MRDFNNVLQKNVMVKIEVNKSISSDSELLLSLKLSCLASQTL